LFHNLRASRETELAAEYPIHVVCEWIGNTERIAAKHYLQVTDDYFERAAGGAAKSAAQALQNPVQSMAALGCQDSTNTSQALADQGLWQILSTVCKSLQDMSLPPRGESLPLTCLAQNPFCQVV